MDCHARTRASTPPPAPAPDAPPSPAERAIPRTAATSAASAVRLRRAVSTARPRARRRRVQAPRRSPPPVRCGGSLVAWPPSVLRRRHRQAERPPVLSARPRLSVQTRLTGVPGIVSSWDPRTALDEKVSQDGPSVVPLGHGIVAHRLSTGQGPGHGLWPTGSWPRCRRDEAPLGEPLRRGGPWRRGRCIPRERPADRRLPLGRRRRPVPQVLRRDRRSGGSGGAQPRRPCAPKDAYRPGCAVASPSGGRLFEACWAADPRHGRDRGCRNLMQTYEPDPEFQKPETLCC